MATVKRRGASWQATVKVPGGRERTKSFRLKSDAERWAADQTTAIGRGAWVDPREGRVTLRAYAGGWLDKRVGLERRTVELYGYLLDNYILPRLGDAPLGRLGAEDVRAWHAELAAAHSSTAAKAYRLLASIYRTAVEDDKVVKSPCRVQGASVEHATERPVASVAEVAALADAMPEHLRVVVLLAAWCQLRRGELFGLRRRDVDLLHVTLSIRVTRTITMTGEQVVKGPKTPAGRRTIAMPPNVLPALTSHLERFVGPDPDALVVVGEKGGPLLPHVMQKAWNRARTSIGRPDLHLHDLRHSGLTWTATAGATTAELMHRAGHASPAAALRYQHATADRDRALAAVLADLEKPATVAPIGHAGRPADISRTKRGLGGAAPRIKGI